MKHEFEGLTIPPMRRTATTFKRQQAELCDAADCPYTFCDECLYAGKNLAAFRRWFEGIEEKK